MDARAAAGLLAALCVRTTERWRGIASSDVGVSIRGPVSTMERQGGTVRDERERERERVRVREREVATMQTYATHASGSRATYWVSHHQGRRKET